jgi:hypothetical protein
VSATKRKDTQDERQASLIPVIERQEQQLRTELKRVHHEVENQIRQAEEGAEHRVRESQLDTLELVRNRRGSGMADLKKQAEQISRSSEKRKTHLQQMAKKNMARAVKRVIDAVTAVGDQT